MELTDEFFLKKPTVSITQNIAMICAEKLSNLRKMNNSKKNLHDGAESHHSLKHQHHELSHEEHHERHHEMHNLGHHEKHHDKLHGFHEHHNKNLHQDSDGIHIKIHEINHALGHKEIHQEIPRCLDQIYEEKNNKGISPKNHKINNDGCNEKIYKSHSKCQYNRLKTPAHSYHLCKPDILKHPLYKINSVKSISLERKRSFT